MEENWKDIAEYEGLYQISDQGRVKSLNYNHTNTERILKPAKRKDGYLIINLHKEGKMKTYLVHRLVAKAFIPNNNLFKIDINHKDEDKTNNNASNLEWCTRAENNNYGTRNERSAKAQINGIRSKAVIQYTLAGKPIALFPSVMEIERRLGFSNGNIAKCCNGKYKTAYKYIWRYA